MRKRKSNKALTVNLISGTEVILIGIDVLPEFTKGLLGFSIYKRVGKNKKEQVLGGGKIFQGVHRESQRRTARSDKAPIQGFMWSDYSTDPDILYTYRVVPVYGTPDTLKPGKGVTVSIKTECVDKGAHAIYFNRGVAGSQAYSRRFGQYRRRYKVDGRWKEFLKPGDVPEREAYKWLSRGLEEAMLAFIGQATGPEYSLRAAVYELTYMPCVQAFVDALERGADVKVIHHAKRTRSLKLKQNFETNVVVASKENGEELSMFKNREVLDEKVTDSVCTAADETIEKVGLSSWKFQEAFDAMFIERTITQISHNKFIILLKNGKPVQVWTGSTNMTEGGIFGQSNVGHLIRDKEVAAKYLGYWEKLSTDPIKKSAKLDPEDKGIRNWTVLNQPDLKKKLPPPNSITPIFSPRLSTAMLDWYSNLIPAAKQTVHFTAAFTVANQIFEKVTKKKRVKPGQPYLRYLMLEGISGLMKEKYPVMAKQSQNKIAWGELLRRRKGSGEEMETLAGLNSNVHFLHTKFMLIDALTDDPIVITGSANFSDASTVSNDENLVIIRGNTRVADIYLTEFMRLFNHFESRNGKNARSPEAAAERSYLVPDDSWIQPFYEPGDQLCEERMLFS